MTSITAIILPVPSIRIGTESVPSTIEDNGLGLTCQFLGAVKLLLHRLDVARTTAGRWEDEGRLLCPHLQCFLDALSQRHVPLRLARLAAWDEDQFSVPPHMLPLHAKDFCRPHTRIEHNQQNVSQWLPAVVRRLRRELAGGRALDLRHS